MQNWYAVYIFCLTCCWCLSKIHVIPSILLTQRERVWLPALLEPESVAPLEPLELVSHKASEGGAQDGVPRSPLHQTPEEEVQVLHAGVQALDAGDQLQKRERRRRRTPSIGLTRTQGEEEEEEGMPH